MDKREIYEEIKMPYEEMQKYLLNKYGGAVCDYFYTPDCRTKNKKVSRTKEGLYCHHMDEDKGGNLSNSFQASRQPFGWQKKERLVYCNALEHLILHMKIAIVRQKELFNKQKDIGLFFTTGGIYQICQEINDMFIEDGTSVSWKKRCFREISDNYGDYIDLVSAFMRYIDNNFLGEKNEEPLLKIGRNVHFPDCDCEIIGLTKKHDSVILRTPSRNISLDTSSLLGMLKYADCIDLECRKMASGFEVFYESIYNDIINSFQSESVNSYAKSLSVDYKGYGYVQFADIALGEEFGSKNADMYIAKALPMFCNSDYSILGKTPIFWKGKRIPKEAEANFFIVRFKTQFDIKQGEEPFVRYREHDPLRRKLIEDVTVEHNMRDRGYLVLSTSDIFDKKTEQFYSQYQDGNGRVVDAEVILSLGRDDYCLFHSIYNVYKEEILDGCYFR